MSPPLNSTVNETKLRSRKLGTDNKTKNKNDTFYTWQEVSKHNSASSCWMVVNGIVYDVTEWINKHPGGKELIILHAGRECTNTFDSYHPFSKKPHQILSKYAIGKVQENSHEFPIYKPDSGFYKKCRERVGEYFSKNKLNPKDPIPGLWRMFLVFVVASLSYFGGNGFVSISFPLKLVCAVLFGICQALPLLHVMHDSSHAAYSSKSQWWQIVGRLTMDWYAGGSMVSWLNQHVVGHHIYTNVAGADPDLPVDFTSDIRRIVERQILKPLYSWQHVYLPPLYGFLGLKFRIQDITETFLKLENGPVRVNPHSLSTWLQLIASKTFWVFYRIWIPLFILKVPQKEFWVLFFLSEFVTGWWLAFNFQVSHVSTECDYPCGKESLDEIQDEWAISQVKSSVDYGHGSFLTTFLSGALNYQVTHHLFPSVSQYHYPAIAPIIIEVCKEYNIQYRVMPSFTKAFQAHINHLKFMGSIGEPVTIHMG